LSLLHRPRLERDSKKDPGFTIHCSTRRLLRRREVSREVDEALVHVEPDVARLDGLAEEDGRVCERSRRRRRKGQRRRRSASPPPAREIRDAQMDMRDVEANMRDV